VQRILHYDGLYRQAAASPATDYLYSERLETRSRDFDWVVRPHTHAHLVQLFLIETGRLTFQEASGQRELVAPVVLLIPPTMLHGFSYSPDTTGHILTLSAALVDGLFSTASPVASMLSAVQCLTRFEVPYLVARVQEALELVDQELADNQPEKRLMLHACLQQLFLVLFRIWQQGEALSTGATTLAQQYFRRFQQRVRQVGASHSVAQLADELAITPVHLNRVCRAVAGKSASQLLQEHVLDEARKYLLYSSHSVSEIAYLLHFEYPNYFARFFKKYTGVSPSTFRESQTQAA
jgi:AraC family transcriptional activator of pobA